MIKKEESKGELINQFQFSIQINNNDSPFIVLHYLIILDPKQRNRNGINNAPLITNILITKSQNQRFH